MTTRLTIDVSELRDLGRDLAKLSDDVNAAVRDELDEVGLEAAADYDRRLPRDVSGRTRAGVDLVPAYVKGPTEVRVDVGNTHFVARFLEEGTSKMRPRVALDPAVRGALDGTFAAGLTRRLERLARRSS